ncbi:MAG: hypothetical protein HYY76_20575 [Acidobacteria bacterium]|nr:hypothetical protein [Acidobacteriota bacterium]
MRVLIALLAVLGAAMAGGTLTPAAAADSGYVLAVDQQPGGGGGLQPNVDIDITETGGGQWWADPVWIGVGIVAMILLIVIVALATRGGGGTTVVKE